MSYLKKNQNDLLKKAGNKIRALNHPLRQNLLTHIKSNSNRIKVTDIYVKMRMEQSVASAQLGILRREGFVTAEREGRTIWYSVNDAAIKEFLSSCAEILK